MGKSKPEKDLRSEARDLVDELPDETASGRMVRDDGTPASADEWLRDRSRAMKGQQNQSPSPMSMPQKKNPKAEGR